MTEDYFKQNFSKIVMILQRTKVGEVGANSRNTIEKRGGARIKNDQNGRGLAVGVWRNGMARGQNVM